jgi:ubiquinone/menaquinone biosynthesis C-methylase UbiE
MTEAKVRQQYDRLAAIYDQRWRRYVTRTLKFLQDWVQLSPTETVLDIACGTGEFERMILTEHPTQSMMGVDISEQMLAIAQQKFCTSANVLFQIANVCALPFADDSFDVVVSASAFHYFEHPEAALQEMKRVLKPNGRLVILDWCKDFLTCRICDIVLKIVDPAHRQCYTQAEFYHLLTTTEFKVERGEKVRFSWIWGLMIATATQNE